MVSILVPTSKRQVYLPDPVLVFLIFNSANFKASGIPAGPCISVLDFNVIAATLWQLNKTI
jgi:hypothetical protein